MVFDRLIYNDIGIRYVHNMTNLFLNFLRGIGQDFAKITGVKQRRLCPKVLLNEAQSEVKELMRIRTK
jgi:hypothetical protein